MLHEHTSPVYFLHHGLLVASKIAARRADAAEQAHFDEMRRSTFCLIPAGDSPPSSRLYLSIAAGCVPVFLSDHFDGAFASTVPWETFSLRVPEEYVSGRALGRPRFNLTSRLLEVATNSSRLKMMQEQLQAHAVDVLWEACVCLRALARCMSAIFYSMQSPALATSNASAADLEVSQGTTLSLSLRWPFDTFAVTVRGNRGLIGRAICLAKIGEIDRAKAATRSTLPLRNPFDRLDLLDHCVLMWIVRGLSLSEDEHVEATQNCLKW